MINNLFVSYKLAKALKDAGYNEITKFGSITSLYDNKKKHVFYLNFGIYTGYHSDGGYIDAPLCAQVIDWFREDRKLNINVFTDMGKWDVNIYSFKEKDCVKYIEGVDTYYNAVDKGIKAVLKLINKK